MAPHPTKLSAKRYLGREPREFLTLGWRRSFLRLRDARLDQLADECGRQGLVGREVERATGLLVVGDIAGQRLERRSAERKIGTPLRRRAEACDHHAVEAKSGKGVADAFLGLSPLTEARYSSIVAAFFRAITMARLYWSAVAHG